MLKDQAHYQKLAYKWQNGTLTPEEEVELTDWFNQIEDAPIEVPVSVVRNEDEHRDRLFSKINELIESKPKTRRYYRLGIAASLVITLLSVGSYWWHQPTATEFPPTENGATLTLADGKVIRLNDIEDGNTVDQGSVKMIKEADGLISYSIENAGVSGDASRFNTISTPKGGQYKIVLFDGTKVWLNAASTLTYPTVFSSGERKVILKGEGYFEVSENKELPFKVQTDRQEIVVLGTAFNVNSYEDEGVTHTTLIEGSLRVIPISFDAKDEVIASPEKSVLLSPGQQANLLGNNEINISVADTDIAWRKGIFSFNDSNIETVIQEFSRWYNVDIEFKGAHPNIKLWGQIDRKVNVEEAMEILKYFDLKFKVVQGSGRKKIIIS